MASAKATKKDHAKAGDQAQAVVIAFGTEVKRRRLQMKDPRTNAPMSQEALAEAAGISVSYVSMAERAKRAVQWPIAFKLANALGTTPRELFFPAAIRV